MKKINLLGEEITLKFNMATMLAYEEITGEPFFGQQFETQKSRYALLYAVIMTSKPETGITADALLKDAEWEEINAAFAAVTDAMSAWFNIPDVVAAEQPSTEQADGDDDDTPKPKN